MTTTLGIRFRLLIPLLSITTLVLLLAGYFQQLDDLRRLRTGRTTEIQACLDRLDRILPAAVEDLDVGLIRNALQGEMAGLHIGALTVHIGSRQLVDLHRPGFSEDDPDIERLVHPIHLATAGLESATLSLTTDPAPLREAISLALWKTTLVVVVVDLLVALAVWLVVTQVTAPITRLTTVARAMADGDLGHPLKVTSRDEIGELSRSFDRMRIAIRGTIATIEQQNRDLDARVQERSRQLEQAQAELLEAANLAGKAELATGVLHNIGNVLTGVFIDLERLRHTRGDDLGATAGALAELFGRFPDGPTLGAHLLEESTGHELPRLVRLVLLDLVSEEAARQALVARLEEHLTMIRDIVSLQQAHATGRHFVQAIDLGRIVEDMLLLHAVGLRQRGITVVKQFEAHRPVEGDRVKLCHVVANLIKNAQDALVAAESSLHRLTVSTAEIQNPPGCRPGLYGELRLVDTGCGISPEDQTRLFTHGFTTKRDGHGFGLHACANAMTEMGGTIRIESDGVGCGTTVVIQLPLLTSQDPEARVTT